MSWPGDEAVVTSLALSPSNGLAVGKAPQGKIEKVELLGHSGALKFTQDTVGLHVKFPAEKP